MAIVPDLSGTRPGRTGNIPLSDPRNRSHKERSLYDDPYNVETQTTLIDGNQAILAADKTRNAILFMTAAGSDVVYLSTNSLSAEGGIPVYPTTGLQIKGKAAESAYYCWGVAGVILTTWVG